MINMYLEFYRNKQNNIVNQINFIIINLSIIFSCLINCIALEYKIKILLAVKIKFTITDKWLLSKIKCLQFTNIADYINKKKHGRKNFFKTNYIYKLQPQLNYINLKLPQ